MAFWYSNVESLVNKIDEWSTSIKKHNPTVILMTETWLNSKITDSMLQTTGYSIFRQDREGQVGGGVCVLVKESINGQKVYASVTEKYRTPSPMQSLWINVKIGSARFLVSCIYRPDYSTEDADQVMIKSIKEACMEDMAVYIVGDFNYRYIDWKNLTLYSPDKRCGVFLESYLEMSAHQMVPFLTRYRGDQASLLDLLLVNDKKLVYDLHSEAPIGKSDHVVIVGKTQIRCISKPTQRVLRRNFWKADYGEINRYIADQANVPSDLGADKYVRCMEICSQAIEKYVPLKPTRTNTSKPWLSHNVFKEIDRKRKLWDRHKKRPTIESYSAYRTQSNATKRIIENARKKYEGEIAASKSSKQFFRYVSRNLNSKVSAVILKDQGSDSVIDNDLEIGERFADQFSEVFTVEDDGDELPDLPATTRCPADVSSITFTAEKVKEAICNLKTDSSPGPDEIPAVFLQRCSGTISGLLAEIMNDCLERGELPEVWKLSIVTPLYKKGNRNLPGNYRPISLTCNMCKCMEKIIVRKLTSFLLENHTISEFQHGFLPGRSTITNLISCLDSWTKSFDKNEQVDVIYLDFEKAFDKVPHNLLLYKLEHHGVRGSLLMLIKSFLKGRSYQVRVNGSLSSKRGVLSGVPQGSVLGPLLFLVYIGDLADNIKTTITFFADDTKLYANPTACHFELQEDLKTVESWSNTWKMGLNEGKCTVLSIGTNVVEHPYSLNNTTLRHVSEQSDLGVIVTCDLKWETHISKIVKKANSFTYCMQKAFQDRSVDTILKIYKYFIRPKLEYAQAIWSPYFVKDIDILERSQRRISKIPFETSNEDYSTRLSRLQLTTLRQRRLRGDLIETYKITQRCYQCSLDIYHPSQNVHLRGNSKKLEKEKNARLPRKNFLINRVVYLWNSLSEEAVSAPSVNAFKSQLDRELSRLMNMDIHYGR